MGIKLSRAGKVIHKTELYPVSRIKVDGIDTRKTRSVVKIDLRC